MSKHVENVGRKGLIGSFARLVGLEGKSVLNSEHTPEGPSEVPAKSRLELDTPSASASSSPVCLSDADADADAVSVFDFEGHPVRVMDRAGEPWWVLADVCSVLRLKNPSLAASRLDADERAMYSIGRQGSATIINESGLYSLVLTSRKPDAKRFKKWVTASVLPAVRKTGSYVLGEERVAATTDLNELEALQEQMLKLIDRKAVLLEERLNEAKARLTVVEPKAIVYDAVVATSTTDLQTAIRTFDGVNSMKISSDLVRLGYLYTVGRHSAKRYRVRTEYRGKLFDEKFDPHGQARKIQVLDEGWKVLAELYQSGKLTMKGDFRGDLKVH